MNDNKVKKKIWIGLAVLILILISACSSTPELTPVSTQLITDEPTPTEEREETEVPIETNDPGLDLPCTISLWHSFNEDEIESLLSVSDAYKEIHPDVEFDFMFSPNFDMQEKYIDASGKGGGPSILIGSGDWGPSLFEDFLVLDLTDLIDQNLLNTVNSAALSSVQYKGAMIGLPLNVQGVLLFRNADIVSEAPESFSDLINMAQSATSGDLIGAYLDYGMYYSAGHLEAIGGSLMDAEGNPTFNDQNGIEWLEMLKRFEEAGPIQHNNDNDLGLFLENRVGIIIDDLTNAAGLADAIGTDNFKIDEWPMDMSGFIHSDVVYLNANLTNHDLDCGATFMEFLLSSDAQEMFSDPSMAGFIPVVKGLELTDPLQSQAAEAFTLGTPLPVIPEMSTYWEPLNFALQSVVEFEVSPVDALSAAEAAITAKLSEMRQE